MTRKPRGEFAGALYHVIPASTRSTVFHDDVVSHNMSTAGDGRLAPGTDLTAGGDGKRAQEANLDDPEEWLV